MRIATAAALLVLLLVFAVACGGIAATTATTVAAQSVATTASSPEGDTAELPSLVGLDLQSAQDTLQAAGWYSMTSHDATGQDRAQVLDSNWVVVEQSPAAGSMVSHDATIDMGVVKEGESGSEVLKAATTTTTEPPTATTEGVTTTEAPTTTEEPLPDVPTEYLDALSQAGDYSEIMHMSKKGIYDQLVSEYGGQFSKAAAQYAIDHVVADWNANALAQAKDYRETLHMSPAAIHDQLTSQYGGQFTESQADYAIAHLND